MATKAELEQVIRAVVREEMTRGIDVPPWARKHPDDPAQWTPATLARNTNMQAERAAEAATETLNLVRNRLTPRGGQQ